MSDGYFSGSTLHYGRNYIGHSQQAYCVEAYAYSTAQMEGNFWTDPPASGGITYGELDQQEKDTYFSFDAGSVIDADTALVDQPFETMNCSAECTLDLIQAPQMYDYSASASVNPGPFLKSVSTPTGLRQQLNTLRGHGLAGNIPAAYGAAQSLLTGATTASEAFAIAGCLFKTESEYLKSYPDSVEQSMRRMGAFLDQQVQSNLVQGVKDATRFFLAKTYARYRDLSSAKSQLAVLTSGNPTSHLQNTALLLTQNVALALHDTSAVEQSLSSLYALDSVSTETAMASVNRQLFYRLREIPVQQRSLNLPKYTSETKGILIPQDISLEQNTPNPFNPSTSITYGIPEETHVKLAVYDNLGREIKVLTNGWKAAGTYTVTFDAADLPSGMYLYRIETAKGSVSRKMMLMK